MKKNTPVFFRYGIIAMLLLVSIGCSRFQPLSGRVTYSDDGKPLERGYVCFVSATGISRGPIGADGQYVVGSLKQSDGLPKGEYRVYIIGAGQAREMPKDPKKAGRMQRAGSLIADKYASPDTSGLTFIVDGSNKKFNFQVDRAGQ